jgi:hypothetical protein
MSSTTIDAPKRTWQARHGRTLLIVAGAGGASSGGCGSTRAEQFEGFREVAGRREAPHETASG